MNDTLHSPQSLPIEVLVERFRASFPGWHNFQDERLVKEELAYKRKTVTKAQDLLAEAALRALAERGEWDGILSRFESVGKDNNLLYRAVPMAGDLGALYQPDLDKPGFCRALIDLVHGRSESAERLDHYLSYVEAQHLPNKWTFPTYFLFFCHPDGEIFVKPSVFKAFLKLVGAEHLYTTQPSAEGYRQIRAVVHKLRGALEPFGVKDMIDVQSFIWVVVTGGEEDSELIGEQKRQQFAALFAEFLTSYPATDAGQRHIALYLRGQEQAKDGLASIRHDLKLGRDVTDKVLLSLLPYADTEGNRTRRAWICVAQAITKDVKAFFEGAGWIRGDQWPAVAQALLSFVNRCLARPQELDAACREFASLPYSKGLQSGFLSPILNALSPQEFLLVNSKSRKVLKYLTGKSFDLSLRDYPEANMELKALVDELSDDLSKARGLGLLPSDVFDMFCHWLVAVKKFPFNDTKYWKIAPGEDGSEWKEWREGGFAGIGWAELGDVSELTRPEYEKRRNELVEQHEDWTRSGVDQVWRFARQIKEGDYVIANRGTREVLGLGVVRGPYYFEPGDRFGHRLPIEWLPFEPVEVGKGGWRRTLIELNAKEFEEIRQLAEGGGEVSKPPGSAAFSETAFDLLAALSKQPTREYYSSHKQEFVDHLERPFQALFGEIIAILPPPITEAMETERNVFSRILKNDWGRGGAWDFYWGALYPKGGRRVEDAQLFVWINQEWVEYGFYIGVYGSDQRKRYVRNCHDNHEVLKQLLGNLPTTEGLVWGPRPDEVTGISVHESGPEVLTFDEWLRDPGGDKARAAVWLKKREVIGIERAELATRIAQTFQALFPLVLLATLDDPLPKVREYLEGTEEEETEENPLYPMGNLAVDTGLREDLLERWVRAIERKKQAIIYGPPGTGKTFVAQHLAKHLVAGTSGFVELVQFHPSYAYEDFIQGIRPQRRPDGQLDYQLVPGRFLEFCAKARAVQGPCVLMIDEINRANLSRVFGELMFLIEYRDQAIPLAGKTVFRVPENVRIIGTMNTADRSIALVDHALRRRFAFLHLAPSFDVLRSYHQARNAGFNVEGLIAAIRAVNQVIDDVDYEVGITFFLRDSIEADIEDIWRMEIEPYLREYFFDHPEIVDQFKWEVVGGKILP